MEMNRIVSIFAGFMVMLSLVLAHWMGQVDLSHVSWLWLTLFVGFNLFQMGFTGFCPLVKILGGSVWQEQVLYTCQRRQILLLILQGERNEKHQSPRHGLCQLQDHTEADRRSRESKGR